MIDQFEEFSDSLPSELLRRAYRTGNELAWTRADAIEAISRLENAGFILLGVDVWVPSSPGPQMTGWSWNIADKAVPNRSQTAQQFVKAFEWGRDDANLKSHEPFFNLTTAEKPD